MPPSAAVVWRLVFDAALAEAVTALRGEGIEALLLRGPAIAEWLYDGGEEREYRDVDLLVPARDHAAAEAVLAGLGYGEYLAGTRASERVVHATTWSRGRVPIDLHHRLALLPGDPYADLAEEARTLTVGDVAVLVPRPASLAVIVVLHAAQHGPSTAKSLEDLRRAVAHAGDLTWCDAAALARRLGVAGEVAAGLAMVDGGVALAERLGLGGPVDPVVRLRIDGGPPLASRMHELRRSPDHRARALMLLKAVLPSPAYLRMADPVARLGPLGLVAAYVRRPLRIAARLPVAAWHYAGALGWRQPFTGVISGAMWAYAGVRSCRRYLRAGPLDHARVPRPPEVRRGSARGVRLGLAAARPTCLERSLVRRTWHLAQGRDRRVVIAVSRSGEPFGAHAWLEGDAVDGSMLELLRWPPV